MARLEFRPTEIDIIALIFWLHLVATFARSRVQTISRRGSRCMENFRTGNVLLNDFHCLSFPLRTHEFSEHILSRR